jgi:beta-galactosidase GanA
MACEHGAQALLYHNWRPPLFGAETAGFGILKADGSPTKRLEVIKKLAKYVAATFRSPKNGVLKTASTAIAYLRSSEVQSYQEQGPPRGIAGQWEAARTDIGLLHGLSSLQGAYQLAVKKYKIIDFIFEQDLTSGVLPYKTMLLPNPYLLSRKQFENLKKWVNQGGTLITEARFGLKDENGHLYPNPLLEELLGVTWDHGEITKDGFLDVIEGRGQKETLLNKKVGKGRVVYANFSLFLKISKKPGKWAVALKRYL